MKKLFSVLLMIIITAVLYGCSKNECEKLIVVIDSEYPPYGFTQDGKIVGLDIEITEAIANKIGCKVELMVLPFSEALLALQKGEADILAAGVTKTAERELIMNFSTPYYFSKQIVLKKTDNNLLLSSQDINIDTRVGVQQGTVGHMFAQEELECTIASFATFNSALNALDNDEIDCIIIDHTAASYYVANREGLKIIDEALFEYGISLVIRNDDYELLETANSVIDSLVNNGKIEEIIADFIK